MKVINITEKLVANKISEIVGTDNLKNVACGELVEDMFGFRNGDLLIFQTVFNLAEITSKTLVVIDKGKMLDLGANVKNTNLIVGVLIAFQREVQR